GSSGNYAVSGSHQYAEEGSHSITVTVNDVGGKTTTVTGSTTVNDAALHTGTITTTTAGVEGVSAASISASFTDDNTAAPTSDFSGTINWGDTTTTTFTSADVSGSSG